MLMSQATHALDKGSKMPLNVFPGFIEALEASQGPLADAEQKTHRSRLQRLSQALKILLPHVGLTVLLLSYIAGGAAIFQWLETSNEMARRKEKFINVTSIYHLIVNETVGLCHSSPLPEIDLINATLIPLLRRLSIAHEYDDRFTAQDQLWSHEPPEDARWTFPAAVLYALTVITTTGYDHITPTTNAGRLFAVFFGLIGIPLMFITAADIGKFLSEMVTRSYAKLIQLRRYLRKRLVPERRSQPKLNGDVKKADSSERLDELLGADSDEHVELPVFAYFFLILGYCAIGGLLFTSFEYGPIWSFIHGFFFSFNTITTIGLGNILVRNVIYLILIVFYVIVGLAVITMCVDLASSQLKVFFTKLHYFGRKFKGARGAFMNMSDDIKEAMKIIAALKKNKPNKDGITLEDLKNFLEVEQQLRNKPYVPKNVHFFRWIEDEEISSARSASISQSLKHAGSDPALHM